MKITAELIKKFCKNEKLKFLSTYLERDNIVVNIEYDKGEAAFYVSNNFWLAADYPTIRISDFYHNEDYLTNRWNIFLKKYIDKADEEYRLWYEKNNKPSKKEVSNDNDYLNWYNNLSI